MVVDLLALRRTIRVAPERAGAAIVTRGWLQQVERDLSELERRRQKEAR